MSDKREDNQSGRIGAIDEFLQREDHQDTTETPAEFGAEQTFQPEPEAEASANGAGPATPTDRESTPDAEAEQHAPASGETLRDKLIKNERVKSIVDQISERIQQAQNKATRPKSPSRAKQKKSKTDDPDAEATSDKTAAESKNRMGLTTYVVLGLIAIGVFSHFFIGNDDASSRTDAQGANAPASTPSSDASLPRLGDDAAGPAPSSDARPAPDNGSDGFDSGDGFGSQTDDSTAPNVHASGWHQTDAAVDEQVSRVMNAPSATASNTHKSASGGAATSRPADHSDVASSDAGTVPDNDTPTTHDTAKPAPPKNTDAGATAGLTLPGSEQEASQAHAQRDTDQKTAASAAQDRSSNQNASESESDIHSNPSPAKDASTQISALKKKLATANAVGWKLRKKLKHQRHLTKNLQRRVQRLSGTSVANDADYGARSFGDKRAASSPADNSKPNSSGAAGQRAAPDRKPLLTIAAISITRFCTNCLPYAIARYRNHKVELTDGDWFHGFVVDIRGDRVLLVHGNRQYSYYPQS